MRVLGLDVATRTGWAVVDRDTHLGHEVLLDYGVVDLSRGRAGATVAALAARLYASEALCPDLVVIESPYVARNVATSLLLARLVGRWEQACHPTPTELVTASAWQAEMLRAGAGMRRTDRKLTAIRVARAIFGVDLASDAADAAVMAVWAMRRARLRRVRLRLCRDAEAKVAGALP